MGGENLKLGIWKFYVLLCNAGLFCGTVGFIVLTLQFPILIDQHPGIIALNLLYLFFYLLLLMSVLGLDYHILRDGWKQTLLEFQKENIWDFHCNSGSSYHSRSEYSSVNFVPRFT